MTVPEQTPAALPQAAAASPPGSASSASQRAGVLVLGKILATVSEALVPLVIVRLLGKADVGVLSSSLLVYSTVALVFAAGIGDTLTFFLPTRPIAERRAIAFRAARVALLLGLAAGALLLLISLGAQVWAGLGAQASTTSGGSSRAHLADLWLLALYPVGELPARLLPNLLIAEGRAGSSARFGIVKALGSALAALLPLALGASVPWVLFSMATFGLLYGSSLWFVLRSLYAGVPRTPSPVSFMGLLRFGGPLAVTDIVALLNNQLDRYLILVLLPIAALADYQAGAWQIPILSTVAYAVGAAYAPDLVALFQQGRAAEALKIWRESALKVALIVVPFTTVFLVAAEETMELLFTKDYVGAANVFRCYAALTLGRVATFGSLLVAAGRPGLVFRAAVFALVSNVVLSVPLAFGIGFLGPALGTALAFVPTLVYYSLGIASATGQPLSHTFPLAGYLKVLALAALCALPAVWFKLSVTWGALSKIGGTAAIVLLSFALLGTLSGLIVRSDWVYLRRWLRFKLS